MVSLAYWGTRDEVSGLTYGRHESSDRTFRSAACGLERKVFVRLWHPDPGPDELAARAAARRRIEVILQESAA